MLIESIPQEKREIIEKSNALLTGHFLLTSGLHSQYYLQSALITQTPAFCEIIANDIASNFKNDNIDVVLAPAVGGIVIGYELARSLNCKSLFAERQDGKLTLRRGFSLSPSDKVLLVEDVITTAGSILELKEIVDNAGAKTIGFASIFNRSGGKFQPEEKFYSWQKLIIETFQPEDCPFCKDGSVAYKPGSRGLK